MRLVAKLNAAPEFEVNCNCRKLPRIRSIWPSPRAVIAHDLLASSRRRIRKAASAIRLRTVREEVLVLTTLFLLLADHAESGAREDLEASFSNGIATFFATTVTLIINAFKSALGLQHHIAGVID